MGKYLTVDALKWAERSKVWVTLTAGHVFTKMFTEVSSHYNLCEVSPRSKTSSPLNLSTRFLMEKARVQKHDKSL